MPKIKTNRAAAKRFKKTGTGKLKRNKAYKSHIYDHRCNKCKEHEEGTAVPVRIVGDTLVI